MVQPIIFLQKNPFNMVQPSAWSPILSVLCFIFMVQIAFVVSTSVYGLSNGNKICPALSNGGKCVTCGIKGTCDVVYCSNPILCKGRSTGGCNSPRPIMCLSQDEITPKHPKAMLAC